MSNSSSDIKTDGEKKREKERGKERQRKPPLLLPLRKNAQKSDLCGSDAATIQRLQFTWTGRQVSHRAPECSAGTMGPLWKEYNPHNHLCHRYCGQTPLCMHEFGSKVWNLASEILDAPQNQKDRLGLETKTRLDCAQVRRQKLYILFQVLAHLFCFFQRQPSNWSKFVYFLYFFLLLFSFINFFITFTDTTSIIYTEIFALSAFFCTVFLYQFYCYCYFYCYLFWFFLPSTENLQLHLYNENKANSILIR